MYWGYEHMINVVSLGHLAADPTERDTSTGGKFAAFPLATSDKNGTYYLSCRAFGSTAKTALQYLKKGAQILIFGTIYEVKTYKANDDTIKPQLTVTVDHFNFVSSKDKSKDKNKVDIPF